jgi:hypothetical protein
MASWSGIFLGLQKDSYSYPRYTVAYKVTAELQVEYMPGYKQKSFQNNTPGKKNC